MGPFDALWHLFSFFAPALGVALITAVLAKLIWRRELAAVRLLRLALWPSLAGALALFAGLVFSGHDGRMGTYLGLVGAVAFTLWWIGLRGRPR
jgi:heme/copper-type cytochrome/quinol oxidase subunit 1